MAASASLKKPAYPKKVTKVEQRWRTLLLWVGVPTVLALIIALYPSFSERMKGKKVDLSDAKTELKKVTKDLEDANVRLERARAEQEERLAEVWGDIYGSLWQPTEQELFDFKGNMSEPSDVSNGVLVYVYATSCIYCKNFAMQLLKHNEQLRAYTPEVTALLSNATKDAAREIKHRVSFNQTMEEKRDSQLLMDNVRVAALNIENVTTEFRTKHNIERFPTLMFMQSKDTFYSQDEELPILNDGVNRLVSWLRRLQYEQAETALKGKMSVLQSIDEVEAHTTKEMLLNAGGSAGALFSVSKAMRSLFDDVAAGKEADEVENAEADVKKWKRHTAFIENEELEETSERDTPYYITRYVTPFNAPQIDNDTTVAEVQKFWHTDYRPTRRYFKKEEVQGAAEQVFSFMKKAQFPSFSRIFPEAIDRHLKVFPALLVVNQAVTDSAELDTLHYLFETFEYGLQTVYMDPYDAPDEAKKWFGFDWKKASQRKVVLFSNKKGHKEYSGKLADAQALTDFVVETLTAWHSK